MIEGHRRDVNVEVDAVKERTGDLGEIPLNLGGATPTPMRGIREPATTTGIHGGDEEKAGGEAERALGAGDVDLARFQWLSEALQDIPVKLRQLIEKEHPVMRQGRLSRLRDCATADQGHDHRYRCSRWGWLCDERHQHRKLQQLQHWSCVERSFEHTICRYWLLVQNQPCQHLPTSILAKRGSDGVLHLCQGWQRKSCGRGLSPLPDRPLHGPPRRSADPYARRDAFDLSSLLAVASQTGLRRLRQNHPRTLS